MGGRLDDLERIGHVGRARDAGQVAFHDRVELQPVGRVFLLLLAAPRLIRESPLLRRCRGRPEWRRWRPSARQGRPWPRGRGDPSAPCRTACQIPFRSGFPSGVRGALYAGLFRWVTPLCACPNTGWPYCHERARTAATVTTRNPPETSHGSTRRIFAISFKIRAWAWAHNDRYGPTHRDVICRFSPAYKLEGGRKSRRDEAWPDGPRGASDRRPAFPASTVWAETGARIALHSFRPNLRNQGFGFSVGSLPSLGAPVPDEPMNSLRPSAKVRSRPLALLVPSLA